MQVCRLLLGKLAGVKEKTDLGLIRQGLQELELSGWLQCQIWQALSSRQQEVLYKQRKLAKIVLSLFDLREYSRKITTQYFFNDNVQLNEYSLPNWAHDVLEKINFQLGSRTSNDTRLAVLECCIHDVQHDGLLQVWNRQRDLIRQTLTKG